ncbi:MAG: N-acetyltransferase [Chloroflexi bacterium]|nr:N-acetyltransferase [Chloroflexota bacterium]
MEAPAIEITDAVDESRFEARVYGELAGILEYVEKRGRLALSHTEVLPEFEGRGIASKLAKFGLDEARRRELGVIVICPFVRSYIVRHPEELDIVTAGMR